MQMGKNPATTGSNSKKLVRSYQMSQLFFDLCQVTNTKAKFFEAILFKFKSYLNRRLSMKTICLWPKISSFLLRWINRIVCYVPSYKFKMRIKFSLASSFCHYAERRMRKETMQCHTVSPAKTFYNRLQYFVTECRCVGFSCLAKF